MGIGFVLLLGHIDLSAGVIGGVGAGVMAMLMLKQGLPWYLAVLVALLVGVVMGIFTGVLVSAVGIPSFVVTLATFLAYQGVLLWIIGTGGTVPINDRRHLRDLQREHADAVRLGRGHRVHRRSMPALNLLVYQRRRAANLVTAPLAIIVLRIVVIAVVLLGATFLLSQNRSKGAIVLEGIPWIAPMVGVLLVIWTFVQNRTAFGRHVYAVGGNAEAARRAGIRVGYITIACFVISSAMAVISGIVAASRLSSVDPGRRRRQHPAVRGRRGRHRRHLAVRRQGQGPGRDHRWSGHRRHRQRPRTARAAGLHQVHRHRHRAAARRQRRRPEPSPPGQRRSLTAPIHFRPSRSPLRDNLLAAATCRCPHP